MLPRMGFGGAPLGDLFTRITDAEAQATLTAAWDAGIRYYDTAPWYGRGQSEHRFGRHLYHRPRGEAIRPCVGNCAKLSPGILRTLV